MRLSNLAQRLTQTPGEDPLLTEERRSISGFVLLRSVSHSMFFPAQIQSQEIFLMKRLCHNELFTHHFVSH